MISDLIRRTKKPIEQALNDASLEKNEIDDILLVGGTTLIPAVREFVIQYFEKEPLKGDPYEAVALGTAIAGTEFVKIKSGVDSKGMEIRVLPSKVKIYYQVGLSDFQKVSEKMFEAVIELPESGDLPEKLKVNLSEVPDFVEIKRIQPLFVEYLIIKK